MRFVFFPILTFADGVFGVTVGAGVAVGVGVPVGVGVISGVGEGDDSCAVASQITLL